MFGREKRGKGLTEGAREPIDKRKVKVLVVEAETVNNSNDGLALRFENPGDL